jgi:hypothetical protein
MLTRRTTCLSNLRQLGVAWHSYLNAYGDGFLRATSAEVFYGGKQTATVPIDWDPNTPLPRPLNPFVRLPAVLWDDPVAGVFRCPGDHGGDKISGSYFDSYGTSYLMNNLLVGSGSINIEDNDPTRPVMKKVQKRIGSLTRSKVDNDSIVILMGDWGWSTT